MLFTNLINPLLIRRLDKLLFNPLLEHIFQPVRLRELILLMTISKIV